MSKKKTPGKYAKKRKKSNKVCVTVLVITILLVAALVAAMLLGMSGGEKNIAAENSEPTATVPADTIPATTIPATTAPAIETGEAPNTEPVPVVEDSVSLGHDLYVTDIGSYTGMYMEDGTDEIVSGVLMIVVKNSGEQDVQYAEITVLIGEETASFTLTTLPADESVVLLESSRMQWQKDVDAAAILPKIEHIAYFQEPVSLQEDKLKIDIVDGTINVTNISGADIAGNIVVYYKNAAAGLYYGGITYRITIEGGLKADEIRQVMTNHASDTGSKIMFVTITQ